MAKINFPLSPSLDQTYTYLTTTWKWNGVAWEKSLATETGNTEGTTGGIAYYDGKSSTIKGALNAFYDETNERVGIGTSGPTELLDVRGGITASGGIFVTGGVTFGSHVGITGGLTADTLKVESELILGGNIILPDEGHIGGGDGQDRIVFDINGNHIDVNTDIVRINSKLEHLGDSNTHLDFNTTDSIKLTAGGNEFLHGTDTAVNIGGCTFEGSGGFTASNMKVENELILGGNIIMPEDGEIQIGGDSEHIVFNGSSAQIEMQANEVFFNHRLQHYLDTDTGIQFETNKVNIHAGDINVDKISVTASGVEMTGLVEFYQGISADMGVTFGGTINCQDQEVTRPKLKDFSETVNAIGTVTGNTAVDFQNGNVQTITINGACELSFSNPPASGTSGTVTLIITNGGSASVTYAAGNGSSLAEQLVKWPSNAEPSLTSSGIDIITFLTTDGGFTVYGFVGGLNFS